MQFIKHKRKPPPNVIIVSLIDVLIVVLIFLLVSTTFKQQQPSVKIALPESREGKAGANENLLVVTVGKDGPLYLKAEPVTLQTLQARLVEAVRQNPQATLAIRSDTEAPVGQVIRIMDAAKAANIKVADIFVKTAQ